MGLKRWAYEKPSRVTKDRGVGGKFLNGVAYVGKKVGQWTVRPGVKAYDFGKGKKK